MRYRTYPRTGWQVSEIGYGMWGLGGWTGSDDAETAGSLTEAVRLGCTFFDTAWAYGAGKSERILADLVRAHPDTRLYVATKVPPKNQRWIQLDGFTLDDVFPPDHIRRFTEKSLENLGVDAIDLQQLHAWSDRWAGDDRWKRVMEDLKREGLVRSWGISVNRWEHTNVVAALESGVIDAVQVVYNVFDQAPEDELLPYCQRHGIAVIARVPFDEGSLTGTLTSETRWPEGDWRNLYFTPDHLAQALTHVEALKADVPEGMSLPELALRFILHHPAVTTVIPGMRKLAHVRSNVAAGDGPALDAATLARLRRHRWERDWVVP
jgi:aryl-alcohol dehydrogenase-like predicted oxidoreductase